MTPLDFFFSFFLGMMLTTAGFGLYEHSLGVSWVLIAEMLILIGIGIVFKEN